MFRGVWVELSDGTCAGEWLRVCDCVTGDDDGSACIGDGDWMNVGVRLVRIVFQREGDIERVTEGG